MCGDGHVGIGTDNSQYRQVDKDNLGMFLLKLLNTFGKFRISIFEGSKLIIPRVITDFYRYYFGLSGRSWDTARIPESMKAMPKDFLLAGLAAFIVDEGHVGDFIEVYSKNYQLINDIAEIASNIGYEISCVEKKYRYDKFDSFRFIIRPKSLCSMNKDLNALESAFPTCSLSNKSEYLRQIVRTKNRGWDRRKFGETKRLVLKFLNRNQSTSRDIAAMSNIRISSMREHLLQLERKNLIKRVGKMGRSILWTQYEKVG
jgi:TusA-related sulfurtransferase